MPGPLAAKIRAKYPGAYDDMDDAALEAAVLAKYPEYRDLAEEAPTEGRNTFDEDVGSAASKAERIGPGVSETRERIGKALPTAAALAASLATGGLGIPAAMAATGAAGGAGSILGSLLGGRKVDTAEAAMQAGLQGGLEGMGRGLGAAGKAAYRVALSPSKAVRRDMPNVAAVGLREGIPVTNRGVSAAESSRTASRGLADRMIAEAEQGGAGDASLRTVVRALRPVRDEARKQTKIGLKDRTPEIGARARALRDQFPSDKVPLTEAQVLKRTAQGKAKAAYAARDKGAVIDDIGTMTDEAVAKGLRESIEARVPGVRPVNQRTAELGALTRALEDRTGQSGGIFPTMMSVLAGGTGAAATGDLWPLLAALGTRMAFTPAALSTGGIAASRLAPAAPNISRAALLAMLDEEPEQ